MSIIPLLIILYFISEFVFSETENLLQVSAIVVFTLWISWLGYLLIRQIINPVIDLALETRIIAEGKYASKLPSAREDELGDIADAVNTMTGRIRSYIGELQGYSRKTAELNVEIHKKVITLTNLMRIGDLITSGAGFDELAKFTVEKVTNEIEDGFSAVFSREKEGNYISKCVVNNTGKDVFTDRIATVLPSLEKQFSKMEYLIMDSRPLAKPWQNEFRNTFGIQSLLVFPMKFAEKVIGLIVLGNFIEGFEFREDQISVVRAFGKELALGYQSVRGAGAVKGMEVVDGLTGLYSKMYLEDRLEDEINRAIFYQRPCSFIFLNLDDFGRYSEKHGLPKSNMVLKKVADLLSSSMPPVGKAARFEFDEFGVILPEKNKRETIEVAEDIRKKVELLQITDDPADRVTISLGVGENPIDGANAQQIIEKARNNMKLAKERGKNQVAGD
jgi:diguanylate cyclase (GGDEF)-like protein